MSKEKQFGPTRVKRNAFQRKSLSRPFKIMFGDMPREFIRRTLLSHTRERTMMLD